MKTPITTRIPITKDTILQRINRRLKKKGQRMYTARGGTAKASVGAHYILSDNNAIVATHVDIESFAREEGELAQFEMMEGSEQ